VLYSFASGENPTYLITKISYGQTVGYTETELTYPGQLIASPGEAITSVLDKVKNMLGDFEYFYDLDGRFVFQKKRNYVNTSWNPIKTDTESGEISIKPNVYGSSTSYSFGNNELITAFNNTPNLANLKNDFAVWGSRKGATGKDLPIHLRYAIDEKPTKYTIIKVEDGEGSELESYNKTFGLKVAPQESKTYTSEEVDWRELIYLMAMDYYKYNHLDSFATLVAKANPDFINGVTGYEQYYVDM
jgi:hypothetical protein